MSLKAPSCLYDLCRMLRQRSELNLHKAEMADIMQRIEWMERVRCSLNKRTLEEAVAKPQRQARG